MSTASLSWLARMPLDSLLTKKGGSPDQAERVATTVIDAYKANQLPYHNLAHIDQTFAAVDLLRHSAVPPLDLDGIFVALWFHDIIYDPRAADNEEQSAILARTLLTRNEFLFVD